MTATQIPAARGDGDPPRAAGLPAIALPDLQPGTPEWMRLMTASKVAAVLGLSPWESRYSLWHRMAGLIDPQPENDEKIRGHYLEPAVAQWFADQHPETIQQPGGTWAHPDRPWQATTPDRLLHAADGGSWGFSETPSAVQYG